MSHKPEADHKTGDDHHKEIKEVLEAEHLSVCLTLVEESEVDQADEVHFQAESVEDLDGSFADDGHDALQARRVEVVDEKGKEHTEGEDAEVDAALLGLFQVLVPAHLAGPGELAFG